VASSNQSYAPTKDRGAAVRVLYIGGAGRSGSTLLDLLLNEVPGMVAVGELKYIWSRGLASNELCGCGQPFHACPFWTAVGERAFGGWGEVDAKEALALEQAVDNHRSMPAMAKPGLSRAYSRKFERYTERLSRLYAAIREVSGEDVIVDSTKRPSSAFLLSRIPELDVRFVQLVRDSRGVAFSWSKRVQRPEVRQSVDFMPRYGALRAGYRWMGNNSLFHVLAALGVPGIRIRYESLIRTPRRELEQIVRHSGLSVDAASLDFVDRSPTGLGDNHIVAGNPLRLDRTSLEFRLDDEWRTSMERRQAFVVLLLTWPLLLRYGYVGPGDHRETSQERLAPSGSPSGEREP
jgi:hypothetical protein